MKRIPLDETWQVAIRLGVSVFLACAVGYGIILPLGEEERVASGVAAGRPSVLLLCCLKGSVVCRCSAVRPAVQPGVQVGRYHLRGKGTQPWDAPRFNRLL